jgi:hypothetical protein
MEEPDVAPAMVGDGTPDGELVHDALAGASPEVIND